MERLLVGGVLPLSFLPCLPCGLFPQDLHRAEPRRRRRLRALGKNGPESPLRTALATQKLVERHWLPREPASEKVFAESGQHRGTIEHLPLYRGDSDPAAGKLGGEPASP